MNAATVHSRLIGRRRFAVAGLCVAVLLSASGCGETSSVDRGANQSLVEIGEHSLEDAEVLEAQGRTADANIGYRRALWAFRYHEKLTGEQPFLLEEAMDGVKRTTVSR